MESARLTDLVALTPPPIGPLLAEKELARASNPRARLVRLTHEREALECELRRIREADAPRTNPAAVRLLRTVDIPDGSGDAFPR